MQRLQARLLGFRRTFQKVNHRDYSSGRKYTLFPKQVAEVNDSILRVFHQLRLCLVSDILKEACIRVNASRNKKFTLLTVSSPWKDTAHAICLSPSSFAIQSARPSCKMMCHRVRNTSYASQVFSLLTLFRTEIDAYVFPKLIPTTVGVLLLEEGVVAPGAVPFACAILNNAPRSPGETEKVYDRGRTGSNLNVKISFQSELQMLKVKWGNSLPRYTNFYRGP